MKLAIMQPYLFPYIGYFQLMNAVDTFVVYDDVNFIKRGWINRNRILVNGNAHLFTVPLKNASQNVFIKNLCVAVSETWRKKFLKTLELSYKKAPFFDHIFENIKEIISLRSEYLTDWYLKSFDFFREYLGINNRLVESSITYQNQSLTGPTRILDICLRENAEQYLNPQGGQKLYDRHIFLEKKIRLSFLIPQEIVYQQFNYPFVPGLSILDVMMFNSQATTRKYLLRYELI
jgi:hypothetical protein